MLNNKGFTMVELLMVVCILAVIMAIAIPSVTSYYESSKISTEKIFIEKVTKLVDDYIAFNANDFGLSDSLGKITKCKIETMNVEYCMDEDYYQVEVYKVTDTVTLANVIAEGLIADSDLVNPRTNLKCDPTTSTIDIYQDEDRVNYYRYTLAGCDISSENFIDTKYVYDGKLNLVYDNFSFVINPSLAELE